jgi:Winged helix-turn-helix DNA-binding
MKFGSKTGPVAGVPTWIIGRVRPRSLEVFCILAGEVVSYKDDEGEISKAKLAERLGISTSTLEEAIRDLVAVGVVEKRVRKSGDGGHLPNAYVIDITHPDSRGEGSEIGGGGVRESVPPSLQSLTSQIEVTPQDGVTSATRPPKVVRIEGRDLAFDAVQDVCGIREGSPRARGIPAALNGDDGIRAQAWRELTATGPPFEMEGDQSPRFERQLAIEIRARGILYRQKMPGIALTPSALKKWWTDLPTLPDPRDGRSGSGADAVRIADEVLQRRRA